MDEDRPERSRGNLTPSAGKGRASSLLWKVAFLVGLVLIGAGLYPLAQAAYRRLRDVEVPCRIFRFGIRTNGGDEEPFVADLIYRYQFAGRKYQSDRLRSWGNATEDYASLAGIRDAIAPLGIPAEGVDGRCFVDPGDPGRAILSGRGECAPGWLFKVMAGLWMVSLSVSVMRAGPRRPSSSPWPRDDGSWRYQVLMWVTTTTGASLALGVMAWSRIIGPWRTRDWQPVPAEVVWSRLSYGTNHTHPVRLLYRYEHDGRVYFSSKYDASGFIAPGGSETDSPEVNFPVGARLTAFIDPGDPRSAVIRQKIVSADWAGVVVLLLFVLPGIYELRKMSCLNRKYRALQQKREERNAVRPRRG